MKNFFFVAGFLLLLVQAAAQTVKLTRGEFGIHPVLSNNGVKNVYPVTLSLELIGRPPQTLPDTIEVDFKMYATSKVKLTSPVKTIVIVATDWPDTAKQLKKTIEVEATATSDFDSDELGYFTLGKASGSLQINECAECSFTIRVTKGSVYDYTKPFWVEVGANFDLVDGPEPNNFFAGVFFSKRDIRPVFYRSSKKVSEKSKDTSRKKFANYRRDSNLAVFAGVFESKTITSVAEQRFALRQYYDSSSFMPDAGDSLKVFTGIGKKVTKRTVRNVGLFYSPQVRLTNSSANANGFHVFASLWTELQWQRIEEETEFQQYRKMDSAVKHRDSILYDGKYNVANFKKERDVRSHYLGLGLPIFFKEAIQQNDNVHLFLNPVFGFTNQPTEAYLSTLEAYESNTAKADRPKRGWQPFYAFQFRLNEEKYGLSFTGEVRGLLKRDNQPFVSLALSKKFDLTKFIEFGSN